MRNLLRQVGVRTGISLGLVLVIVVIVAVFRLIGGRPPSTPYQRPSADEPSVAATAGDDGAATATTTPTAYNDDASVLAAASDFTAAWLQRGLPATQWLDGMRPYCTADLLGRLSGVDPSSVPASATEGTPVIRRRTATYADVAAPIGPGDTLALVVVSQGGRWLVATVDREVG